MIHIFYYYICFWPLVWLPYYECWFMSEKSWRWKSTFLLYQHFGVLQWESFLFHNLGANSENNIAIPQYSKIDLFYRRTMPRTLRRCRAPCPTCWAWSCRRSWRTFLRLAQKEKRSRPNQQTFEVSLNPNFDRTLTGITSNIRIPLKKTSNWKHKMTHLALKKFFITNLF